MHYGKQCGIQTRIWRVTGQGARDKEKVEGKNKNVYHHQTRGEAVLQFGRVTSPPPHSFVQNQPGRQDCGYQVQLAGAHKRHDRRKDEEKKSGAVKAVRGKGSSGSGYR
jgi:hypothetical protein